jgi:hypothetical protein
MWNVPWPSQLIVVSRPIVVIMASLCHYNRSLAALLVGVCVQFLSL